ncbi:MAG: hypothetical protein ACKVW3_03555 [Phycisphaerales bacterium]
MTRTVVFRAAAGLAIGVGATERALAQERVTYSLTWSEVLANTNQPVPSPNGTIEPGEGVRIAIRATITPGIGAMATYTPPPPPPPGTGTIAGFGHCTLDLLGSNANGGSWSNITRNAESNPGGIPGGGNWTLGAAGTPEANGNLTLLQAGQFVLPGMTANATNPIANLWRGTWTPSSYAMRSVSFRNQSGGDPGGQSLLIQYGFDANGDPQYVGKFVAGTYGSTGPIPIVPSPGVFVAALTAGGLILSRKRRTKR